MKLSDIIKSLKAVGSTNTKREILKQHADNEALKLLFYATYDGSVNYWIKADPTWIGIGTELLDTAKIQSVLKTLNGRILTGNAARIFLENIVVRLDPDEAKLLINMVNRDLDCKTSTSLANATWPNLIREFPVMLADKFNEKTAKPFYKAETDPWSSAKPRLVVQKKADGGRCEAVVATDGSVSLHSRNGNTLLDHGVFSFLSEFAGYVVDGELVSVDPVTGKIRDRKTGNGLYNKMVRNTISVDEAKTMHFIVWDLIPIDDFFADVCDIPYVTRFAKLIRLELNVHPSKRYQISIIESEYVHTVAKAISFYERMLAQKEEGAMLKLLEAGWENSRSKSVLKLKEEKDATLFCYGTTPHSKNPDWIGSLECRTADGELEVSIGSGLTEEDRKKDPSFFIGALIDMKYNQLIKAKNAEKWCMFLPIFKNIRYDVTEADSLEKLK